MMPTKPIDIVTEVPESPWAGSVDVVKEALAASEDGLSEDEASKRLARFGPNSVAEAQSIHPLVILRRQFRSLIALLLIVASIISALIGDWMEAVAIVAVIIINALIGFVTELKATRSMEALRRLTQVQARVRRSGNSIKISSDQLVPGDWVILEAGDLVPADMRIMDANALQADESSLTGESVPIRKQIEPVEKDAIVADRLSMLYRGSKITAGTGSGVVTSTGVDSELGKISHLVSKAGSRATPLEKRLDRLGYRLIWITLVLTAAIVAVGVLKGIDTVTMIQTAIALAIAAIPEGLPVVATIALAHGLWRMSERNALINQLSAVETLGATGVICTDKTGTLTENRMAAVEVWPVDSDESKTISSDLLVNNSSGAQAVFSAGVLCNNAELGQDGEDAVGDPLEIALLEAARKVNLAFQEDTLERVWEVPFDAKSRMMALIHKGEMGYEVSVKGAPEAVLPKCVGNIAEVWKSRNFELASQGLRVIAFANKRTDQFEEGEAFKELNFLGLIGLVDPPRPDVPDAVKECLAAGIRVVMITGDQAPTAEAIARQVGIETSRGLTGAELDKLDLTRPEVVADLDQINVFARATPAQKLKLIEHYQSSGQVVAMTGDGVNDAPALKQADIGIAMGLRGTDVAREASAMVLRDDAFPSIVASIRQGRVIFSNIRKFVAYLISCNLSEILVVGIAMLVSNSLPLLPLQILFLNLVTDVFPALAIGVTPSRENVMTQKPRSQSEAILRHKDWMLIGWQALVIALATLGAFTFAREVLGVTPESAVTVSFLTLASCQLFHVFNMAGDDEAYFWSSMVGNRAVWFAIVLCVVLLLIACYVPVLAEVLNLHPPTLLEGLTVLGFAALPVLTDLMRRFLKRRLR